MYKTVSLPPLKIPTGQSSVTPLILSAESELVVFFPLQFAHVPDFGLLNTDTLIVQQLIFPIRQCVLWSAMRAMKLKETANSRAREPLSGIQRSQSVWVGIWSNSVHVRVQPFLTCCHRWEILRILITGEAKIRMRICLWVFYTCLRSWGRAKEFVNGESGQIII